MPTSALPGSALPLVVEGAEKRFGDVRALAGASFDVRRGELVGLLGPNGAGKTTLIKAIAGRLRLDAGTIRLFGRELAREDKRPEIGVVPQELAVYARLTAQENLEVFGRLYGVAGRALRERVEWALDWSDLKERSREPVKGFSGGMRRRLNIACSLLHKPLLVLLDEPTAGVDPQSRERIYEMLADLQKAGVSIVLTTHYLEEAERRCDRIVIIDHGAIVAAGTLRDLLGRTVGGAHALTVELSEPLTADAPVPAGATLDEDRRRLRTQVRDIGPDVAEVLRRLTEAGGQVSDVELVGTSLQDVFIALTGRELRE
jgi:ABC-2 type transport system ATP-binding protein